MKELTIVRADDWEGLYIDGVLKSQGHSLQIDSILEICSKIPPFNYQVLWVNPEWMEDRGDLPDNLDDIPEDQYI